jgi:large subunit ribosomal protein L16
MGKGKAEPEYWVARVKPGTIIYEIVGVPRDVARQAFSRVSHKMPFKCRFVERRHA